MSSGGVLEFHDGRLRQTRASLQGPGLVAVADSWLLVDGTVLALEPHRIRFLAGVGSEAPDRTDEAAEFWTAAMAALPVEGAWSPRVELRDGTFRLLLRPAAATSDTVRLVTASHDPRSRPTVKGPDLDRLATLRDEAQGAGADEAVILSADGAVVEGNYSSLVWWRGDVLRQVAPDVPRLPSVTESSLVTLAAALGVEVVQDEVLPDELDGLEVWAVNSLHGIRIATSWIDGPSLAEEPGRLRLWQTRLDRLRKPVV
ncbi:aminotransferase class IV [Frondihabitans australicus]|uniref:Amino-transferase class IV n=1 Tax=Frondihabitans australicus TaxID=386892 RepID=A0A495IFC0_9MICO|nr:aminotransferase class IV [Frondihabitans australicus]RKR73885.1 amino-transferase class IV [Frondihabitans australicus]